MIEVNKHQPSGNHRERPYTRGASRTKNEEPNGSSQKDAFPTTMEKPPPKEDISKSGNDSTADIESWLSGLSNSPSRLEKGYSNETEKIQPATTNGETRREDRKDAGPPRRWKTVKEVQLFNGNLVLDCPVPPRLLEQVHHAEPPERDEFTHMRYTAVTDLPCDFSKKRYTIRQCLFAKPRSTRLMVAITISDEDEIALGRTLKAVMDNIHDLSEIWGADAWKKVVVCIISDGRAKIHPRNLALLGALGVWQNGIAKASVNGKDVLAHLYEYSVQIRLVIKGKQIEIVPRAPPCQILFCLKEKAQGKINSHRWLFEALETACCSNVCITLDAGTKPAKDAFRHISSVFERDPLYACAVGETKVAGATHFYNPIIASQVFEHRSKAMLDSPLESLFGLRLSSSESFVAYKSAAIRRAVDGDGPLENYFRTESSGLTTEADASIPTTDKVIMGARIFTFELVLTKGRFWRSHYVSSAHAEVDVPKDIPNYLLQRGRSLHGNAFASIYALFNISRLFKTSHSISRKLIILVQLAYHATGMILAWFSIGLFFLTFHIVTASLGDKSLYGRAGFIVAQVFETAYLLNLFSSIIISLGNRPRAWWLYSCVSWMWVIVMIYFCFAIIALVVHIGGISTPTVSALFSTPPFWSIIIPLLVAFGARLLISVLFLSPWYFFTSIIPHILLLATRVNLLRIYAFCSIHEVMWGTDGRAAKPSTVKTRRISTDTYLDATNELNKDYDEHIARLQESAPIKIPKVSQEDDGKELRTLVVFGWVITNIVLVSIITNIPSTNIVKLGAELQHTQGSLVFLAIVFWRIAVDTLIKALGAIIYLLLDWV